jgi:hypothetical protein
MMYSIQRRIAAGLKAVLPEATTRRLRDWWRVAAMHGVALEEVNRAALDVHGPAHPVVVGARR